MAMLTTDMMHDRDMLPLDVYDANGMVIRRRITAFDPDTGVVESLVMDRDGAYVLDDAGVRQRTETYPTPLAWKKITEAEAAARRARGYWDQEGR